MNQWSTGRNKAHSHTHRYWYGSKFKLQFSKYSVERRTWAVHSHVHSKIEIQTFNHSQQHNQLCWDFKQVLNLLKNGDIQKVLLNMSPMSHHSLRRINNTLRLEKSPQHRLAKSGYVTKAQCINILTSIDIRVPGVTSWHGVSWAIHHSKFFTSVTRENVQSIHHIYVYNNERQTD